MDWLAIELMSRGMRGKGEPRGRSSGLGLNGKPGLLGLGKLGRPFGREEFARELSMKPTEPDAPTFGGDLVASSRGTVAGLADVAVSREE